MKTFALLSLVILIVGSVIGVFYWRYQQTDAVRWARRLGRHVAGLTHRLEQLLEPVDRGEIRQLETDLFQQHVRSISVQELARFPGIGPGTVDRVSSRFGSTLVDVTISRFEQIPGIGPVKAKDLRDAVSKLQSEARSRFDAGACPEAVECRRRVAEIKAKNRETERVNELELVAVNATLAECRPLTKVARGVTFFNYYFQRPMPGLTDGILSQPFPQVQGALPVAAPVAAPIGIPIPPRVAKPVAAPVLTSPAAVPYVFPPSPPRVPVPIESDLFAVESVASPTRKDVSQAPTISPPEVADPRLAKLRMIVRFGLFVAKVDGHVAHAERKVLRAYLDHLFGHVVMLACRIDPTIEAEEKQTTYEAAILNEVKAATAADERQLLFALAERIADACGERNTREKEKLERIAVALGLPISAPATPKVEASSPAQISTKPVVKAPVPVPVPRAPKESTSQPPTGLSDLIGRPRAYVRLSVAAALSCGHFGPAERAIVREFLARKGQRSAAMMAQYNHAIDLAVSDAPKLRLATDVVRAMTSDGEKRELLELLGRIVDASGERSQAGAAAIAEVEAVFGICTPVMHPRPAPSPIIPTQTDPRTLLEIPPRAELSVELIRRRFALLNGKLDPAKAAAFGPDVAAMVERKLAELRAAGEALIAPFDEPLDLPLKPPQPTDLRHNPDLDDAFGG